MHIKLVVKATVSQLPGVIYIAMVTLGCSLLELLPGDEKELYAAAVSQLPVCECCNSLMVVVWGSSLPQSLCLVASLSQE